MKEIPVNKRFALGWYNEGVTYLTIHDYAEAMTFFEKALSIIPDHPDFLVGKGDVLYATGKFEEAYSLFYQAHLIEAYSVRILLRLGMALLQLGRYTEALDVFEKGISISEYDGELWLGKGMAEIQLGCSGAAATSFRNASRYKPNQPMLWYYMSKQESTPEEAIRLLLRGYRLDNSNLNILIALTERLLSSGRTREAAEFCRRARDIDPADRRIQALVQRFLTDGK